MGILLDLANSNGEFALKFRKRRFAIFLRFKNALNLKGLIKILDVGGVYDFWVNMGFAGNKEFQITVLNLQEVISRQKESSPNITCVSGDGCDMVKFKDKEFDIVFSNSVIEHVGSFERQKLMAREVQRVGKNFFLQTPNYWFFIEPHFLIVGFQFFPVWLKTFLLRRFDLGWYTKEPKKEMALELANSIRLLKRKELVKLFPKGRILNEQFLIFTKSFIVTNT